MSYQVALKRRLFTTTALSSMVNKRGEVAIDVTKNTLVIFDGSTTGGIPLAIEAHTHANATSGAAGFMSASDKVILDALNAIVDATPFLHGYMSAADKLKLDGIPPGGGGGSLPSSSSNVPSTLVLRDGAGSFSAQVVTAVSFVGPLTGNADTVTNGVVTTGSYSNPSWITALAGSKLTGAISTATIAWGNVTGKPTNVSAFTNDAGYITTSGTITGAAGSVTGQTSSPTANKVIVRDASGRAQVAAPAVAADIATKAYVDANVGTASYTPQAIPAIAVQSGGPFSVIILNVTSEAGLLKGLMWENASGLASAANYYWEFTVDGNAPVSVNVGDLANFNDGTQGTNFVTKSNLDLAYKTSLKVRLYTVVSLGGTIGIAYRHWRWVKNP
jgi:hypothetical protein